MGPKTAINLKIDSKLFNKQMIETYLKLLRLYLKEKLDYTKLSKPITQMDFDEIDNTIFYENLSNFELEELKNQMKLTDYLENTSLSEYFFCLAII